jgi:hypothetical protein
MGIGLVSFNRLHRPSSCLFVVTSLPPEVENTYNVIHKNKTKTSTTNEDQF